MTLFIISLSIICLLQLSNEIIRRCCREINLDKIFDGHVQSSIKTLQECIHSCEQWKEVYNKVSILLFTTW